MVNMITYRYCIYESNGKEVSDLGNGAVCLALHVEEGGEVADISQLWHSEPRRDPTVGWVREQIAEAKRVAAQDARTRLTADSLDSTWQHRRLREYGHPLKDDETWEWSDDERLDDVDVLVGDD